ncbi:MAG: archaeosortase/exosortase family protein [Thermaerobacter sp.]|nr:archaeosortase/exosortase family protein [Thermaerobacter sp.]
MTDRTSLSSLRARRRWIALWLLVAIAPLIPYALPLAQQALSDTPLAYLVWIPPIGFAWAVWVLREHPDYNNDLETNLILGSGLVGIVGLILVAGPSMWPYSFVGQEMGLVLWPLWALGTAWLVFGVTVTPRIAAPLIYLVFAWPPPLTWLITRVQGLLTTTALAATHLGAGALPWIAARSSGTFLVQHGSAMVPVIINSACSGADSVLAVAIVLPVLLAQFAGRWQAKAALVALGAVLALVLNLLRLGLLILALHLWGSYLAFDVLHPVLGFVLFALLVVLLLRVTIALGLSPHDTAKPFAALRGPSLATVVVAVIAALVVTFSLLPLIYARNELPGTSVPVKSTNLARIAPQLPGFRRVLIGRFDDASVLGSGSSSIAYAYSTPQGAYVLAQIYETPNLGALESYTYGNCVAYHGDRTVATLPFLVGSGKVAKEYGVFLPPAKVGGTGAPVADAEWTLSVKSGGETIFLRVALSAPAEPAEYWKASYFGSYRRPLGLLALASAPAQGAMPAGLGTSAQVLRQFAADYESALVRAGGR